MGPYLEGHVLSWIIFLPGGTGLLLLLLGAALRGLFGSDGLPGEVWRAIGLGASLLTFFLALSALLPNFDPEIFGPQFVEYAPWLAGYGAHYFVGLDGINLFLVMLSTSMIPIVLLVSWNHVQRSLRSFILFLLLFETAMLGVFLSLNLLLFHLFWQMYFLVGIWGGRQRVSAATRLLLHTGVGSMMMLAVILVLYRLNVEQGGGPSMNLVAAPGVPFSNLLDLRIPVAGEGVPWWQSQTWLFIGFGVAFGIPFALVPLHGWFFEAQAEAPASASILMASLLLPMGGYGFLRFALPLFPDAAREFSIPLLGLALIGILYGAVGIFLHLDLRKVVAHVSLAQMGFAALGIFSMTQIGLVGGVVALLAQALGVAALLILLSALEDRRSTRQIADFGGISRSMPLFSLLWTSVILSCMGLPGLAFFVPEWLILSAGFERSTWVGSLACLAGTAVALGLYRVHRRVVLDPSSRAENHELNDLDRREWAILLALLVPMLGIGLRPDPLLRRVEPAVLELLREMDERSAVESRRPLPLLPSPSSESTEVGDPS